MEKTQFVNFIATILEESGFKVYRDFKQFQHVIDIYAVHPSIMGNFTLAVACKNYDEEWKVGLDIVKEMEMVGRVLKVSKIVIATTSNFSEQARNYASEKKIKLLDRDNLIILAKKFSKKHDLIYGEETSYDLPITPKPAFEEETSYDFSTMPNPAFEEETSYNLSTMPNPAFEEETSYDLPTMPDPLFEEETSYENTETFSDRFGRYSKTSLKSKYYREQGRNKASLQKTGKNRSGAKNISKSRPFRLKKNEKSSLKSSNLHSSSGILNKEKIEGPKEPLGPKIKKIMNNTIVLILLVVILSNLIALIIYLIAKVPMGIQGLVKILSSLLLSYGLVFTVKPKITEVLLQGSIVFFLSLIIIILMIIFL